MRLGNSNILGYIQNLGVSIFNGITGVPNAANGTVKLDNSGKMPAVDGSALTNLPAVNTSNIVYSWSSPYVYGNDSNGVRGLYIGTSAYGGTTISGSGQVGASYIRVQDSSPVVMLSSKFTKISGISTLTIYGYMADHLVPGQGSYYATLKVDVGGLNNSVNGTVNSDYEWKSFTINVSSLTNGVTYDVAISLAHSGGITYTGRMAQLASIIIIAS